MIRVEVQDDPGQMISVRGDRSLVVQPVQQYTNGLDAISLDEKAVVG